MQFDDDAVPQLTLDLRGLRCPLPVLNTTKAIWTSAGCFEHGNTWIAT